MRLLMLHVNEFWYSPHITDDSSAIDATQLGESILVWIQAEAKDELEQLEKKWNSFLTEYKPLADEAGKTAGNAGAALTLAGEEIKAGYKRLRKLL